jgi:4'-phosphopantetheinyl transferase
MSRVNDWKHGLIAGPGDFSRSHMPLPRLQGPPSGAVHLWFLDLGRLGASLKGALDPGGESASEPGLSRGQLRFARRFYLRLLLGAYLGLPGKEVKINRSVRGKPVLDASVHPESLHFSIARSRDRALVGLALNSGVGVDLEAVGRRANNAMGVARRYFSAAEATALGAMPESVRDMAFLRVWACKEAVVKASGLGIANQLCRFTVETDLDKRAALLSIDGDRADDWSLGLVEPESGLLGAVALRNPGMRVQSFQLLPGMEGATGQ